jgi:hypothetical protein
MRESRPERDRGVDLVAYLDLDEAGRFVCTDARARGGSDSPVLVGQPLGVFVSRVSAGR